VRIEGNQGPKGWEMEVYRGDHVRKKEVHQMDADILEFDLDEDDSIHMLKALTIDVFHSQKSYNPQFLFSNMLKAWGLQKLASVEKIGDYIFKIEFGTEEEKARVLEWGPWRHKSDTLIVVHYDGLMRPLEIKIQTLGLWVRFYDLPPAMLKEGVAKQLGGGGSLESSSGWIVGTQGMRIKVEYPLENPLLPQMIVKIKGRGQMPIIFCYENVPFFYFTCGCIGHAVINYDEASTDDQGISFGEELRASPPKRVKDISIHLQDTKVSRPLFQVLGKVSSESSTEQAMRNSRVGRVGLNRMDAKSPNVPRDLAI
jgi:hypothetical protein